MKEQRGETIKKVARHYPIIMVASIITVALALGCVGNTTETSSTTPVPTTTIKAVKEIKKILVSTSPNLSAFLVDGNGMTLYTFKNDEPDESKCYGECAANWPPMTVEDQPVIGEGVPGNIDVFERTGGTMQVTYNGMPLYYFANDKNPGDTNGQGIKDVWFVVTPIAEPATMPTLITSESTTKSTQTTETTNKPIVTTTRPPRPPDSSGIFIAKASDMPEGSFKEFIYNSKTVMLINYEGHYWAYASSCSRGRCHAEFKDNTLKCPCDGSVYDPTTGEPTEGPATLPLQEVPLIIENDGGIYTG